MSSSSDDDEEGEEVQVGEHLTGCEYDVVPDPKAEAVDLSELRGVGSHENAGGKQPHNNNPDHNSDTELENLAELVPDVKSRRRSSNPDSAGGGTGGGGKMTADNADLHHQPPRPSSGAISPDRRQQHSIKSGHDSSGGGAGGAAVRRFSLHGATLVSRTESMKVQESKEIDVDSGAVRMMTGEPAMDDYNAGDEASSRRSHSLGEYPDSDLVDGESGHDGDDNKIPKEFMNNMSSGQSISTATQTHEVRMPMYLPTFKPATGCTNASDFIVRCFVARLRAGITVVKHGRSRWCKSRLRVLHIHPDGRSLSWKPAEGEPASSRRPPKLDLSTCLEVRHAWSPDPQNPMYTGTPILRQKCEAVNAHKSFALIFKTRTVDITAVTADQCKVLMEGFSALCFRLQVANLAGRGGANKNTKGHARPMPEEDGVSTTASNTLTNTSTPRGGGGR